MYLKNFNLQFQILFLVIKKRNFSFNFSIVDFADYFEDNYVGRPIRGGRRRCARFSISMWNCFNRLDQQLPRSNNSVEAWNKAIKVELTSNVLII
jgi:hypothetical protein